MLILRRMILSASYILLETYIDFNNFANLRHFLTERRITYDVVRPDLKIIQMSKYWLESKIR